MIYEIELPDQPYVSLNNRRDKRWDGPMIKAWRDTTRLCCMAAKVPALTMPTVRLHYWPGDNRRRDRINLALVHKAALDGMIDAGVCKDDDPEHLIEMMPAIHRGKGQRRWSLVIEA